jgi:hypothetical protein
MDVITLGATLPSNSVCYLFFQFAGKCWGNNLLQRMFRGQGQCKVQALRFVVFSGRGALISRNLGKCRKL